MMSSGLTAQRARDADALLLAAGELARQAVEEALVELDHLEQLDDPLVAGRASKAQLMLQRAPHDVAHPAARIERGVGHLIDHLHAAQQVLAAVLERRRQVVPSKTTWPLVGGSRPVMTRASVDLPEPDSPTTATVRPARHLDLDVMQHLDAPP